MSDQNFYPQAVEPNNGRTVGGTEHSWCLAVPGGTGITVLALLLSKPPNHSLFQNALRKLQISHPILRSKIRHDPTSHSFSFVTAPSPPLQLDLPSTHLTHFHSILEHELNRNTWLHPDPPSHSETEVFFASVYASPDAKWTLVLRLHTAACDRTAAASLLKELLELMGKNEAEGAGIGWDSGEMVEVSLGIEDMVPRGKASKPFWARGIDMLGYSLNSFRLANLKFEDASSPRSSAVVRLQMDVASTDRLLAGCKSRDLKLCGVLAAAGLIAAHSSKCLPVHQQEKYGVVTLTDCRSILDPVLDSHHPGFYHSAILNTHDVKGDETLWDLAKRTYDAFAKAKNYNKHFSDMADLNFLMCKAIENPSLTPSSSMRTSFISVFEDPIIHCSSKLHQQIGVEDCIGCASVHGVGPSIAIFDAIRDGGLDCACVYPTPLHSREQMQQLVDNMKIILADDSNYAES